MSSVLSGKTPSSLIVRKRFSTSINCTALLKGSRRKISTTFQKKKKFTQSKQRLLRVFASADNSKVYKITIKMPSNETQEIECSSETYILDAAEEAGLDLPYSCRAGACSSCAAKVEKGKVNNADQSYLDDDQMKAGYILTCTAYPESDCVITTHQEENLN